VAYQLVTPDPISGKPRLRATEIWKDVALESAQRVANERGVPVTVLHTRTRGGNPKLVDTIQPRTPTTS
jgi:hypothetical protein